MEHCLTVSERVVLPQAPPLLLPSRGPGQHDLLRVPAQGRSETVMQDMAPAPMAELFHSLVRLNNIFSLRTAIHCIRHLRPHSHFVWQQKTSSYHQNTRYSPIWKGEELRSKQLLRTWRFVRCRLLDDIIQQLFLHGCGTLSEGGGSTGAVDSSR